MIENLEIKRSKFNADHGIEVLPEQTIARESIAYPPEFSIPSVVDWWKEQITKGKRQPPIPRVARITNADGAARYEAISGFDILEIGRKEENPEAKVIIMDVPDNGLIHDLRAHFAATETPASFRLFIDSVVASFQAKWGDSVSIDELLNNGEIDWSGDYQDEKKWLYDRAHFWWPVSHSVPSYIYLRNKVPPEVIDSVCLGDQTIEGAITRSDFYLIKNFAGFPKIQIALAERLKQLSYTIGEAEGYTIPRIIKMLETRVDEAEIVEFVNTHQTGLERSRAQQANPTPAFRSEEDRIAFGELYDQHAVKIYKFIYRHVGDPDLARDMTNDVFEKAMNRINTFKPKPGATIMSWIYRIADNVVKDHRSRVALSKLPRTRDTYSPDSYPDDSSSLIIAFESEQVRRAMDGLEADQREVIILKFFGGLSNAEVAEIMGRTEGAVKTLQVRALASLGRLMSNHNAS